MPPSTSRIVPVTYDEASEARNRAASAMSACVPQRRNGVDAVMVSLIPGIVAMTLSMPQVSSIGPGLMPLTRTPAGPHSIARHLVNMLTAALDAQTWLWKASSLTASGAVMAISEAAGARGCSKLARER